MNSKVYYVYILTNRSHGVLYTGVTNNLARRIQEHKEGLVEGFTKKYNVTKLVYAEPYDYIIDAIQREKQINAGSRKKKVELIDQLNPQWKDLSETL
ncbi:MAG: GIY-YIG nuclease family protein [Candidatus Uhrbacteria bacterium]|nr:GIY-YIG nuclease family protein [Candidatus Uhrbacteria bacterium]